MQYQSDILNYTKNIRLQANEIRLALRRQFDNDLLECDMSSAGPANEYLRELSKLAELAEAIEFRCDCIDKWLPETAKKRPAMAGQSEPISNETEVEKIASGEVELF
jgi:hypothetical protein